MRIQTGNPVRGDDFFVRENLKEASIVLLRIF